MYAAHLSGALAAERQRTLSDEAAAAHAVRQARGVRRRRNPAGPLSGVIVHWLAALRSRAVQPEFIEAEATASPETVPCSAPVR